MNTDKADFVSPVQRGDATAALPDDKGLIEQTAVSIVAAAKRIVSYGDARLKENDRRRLVTLALSLPVFDASYDDVSAPDPWPFVSRLDDPVAGLRASHDRLKTALERIADLYSDELSVVELSRRMYDARCIALAALESAP